MESQPAESESALKRANPHLSRGLRRRMVRFWRGVDSINNVTVQSATLDSPATPYHGGGAKFLRQWGRSANLLFKCD